MATPNYSYEKRQRELAKKKKKEEKARKKTSDHGGPDAQGDGQSQDNASAPGAVDSKGPTVY